MKHGRGKNKRKKGRKTEKINQKVKSFEGKERTGRRTNYRMRIRERKEEEN